MGLLDDGLPCEVEVCGVAVPVRTGFRRGVRASSLDRRDPDDRLVLMALLYGEPKSWPGAVRRDQRGYRSVSPKIYKIIAALNTIC